MDNLPPRHRELLKLKPELRLPYLTALFGSDWLEDPLLAELIENGSLNCYVSRPPEYQPNSGNYPANN